MFAPAQWPIIIIGGLASAFACALAATGSIGGIVLAYFCQLPLFLVGLGMGAAAGTIAGAIGAVTMAFFGGLVGAGAFLLFDAAPVAFLTRQALLSRPDGRGNVEWYPPGLLVMAATWFCIAAFTAAILWLATRPEGVVGTLSGTVEGLLDAMMQPQAQGERERLVAAVVAMLPGSVAASWLVMTAINGSLAQGLLARFGRNLRPSPDIAGIVLPHWLPLVAAVAILAALLLPGTVGYYGRNLAIILVVPFLFVGLAAIHTMCRKLAAGGILLIVVYVLMLVFGWPVLLVAVLGLVEHLAGLRQRLGGSGPNEEV